MLAGTANADLDCVRLLDGLWERGILILYAQRIVLKSWNSRVRSVCPWCFLVRSAHRPGVALGIP